MKALAINIGGFSIYIPYLSLALIGVVALKDIFAIFWRNFVLPCSFVLIYSLIYFLTTSFSPSVFVFLAKITVTLLMAAMYIYLLRKDERSAVQYLYYGSVVSIVFMVYQAISTIGFGTSLPFTTVPGLDIGRGISSRFGLLRVTGFTEEPSYIAVMLLGTLMILRSYAVRSGESQSKQMWVVGLGLLLCTSNNLFATLPLVLIFSIFSYYNLPFLFFVLFYLVNVVATPLLINVDESFFARFSSYGQFLGLDSFHQLLGIGFGQYNTLPIPQFVSSDGIPSLLVDSLASLWGGLLLEGGAIFTVVFCVYVSKISLSSKNGFGFAFVAILLMLANYYSPWWPIVSLALAYTIVSKTPYKRAEDVQ